MWIKNLEFCSVKVYDMLLQEFKKNPNAISISAVFYYWYNVVYRNCIDIVRMRVVVEPKEVMSSEFRRCMDA